MARNKWAAVLDQAKWCLAEFGERRPDRLQEALHDVEDGMGALIREIAKQISKQMLRHCSRTRMEGNRPAVAALTLDPGRGRGRETGQFRMGSPTWMHLELSRRKTGPARTKASYWDSFEGCALRPPGERKLLARLSFSPGVVERISPDHPLVQSRGCRSCAAAAVWDECWEHRIPP